MVNFLGIKLLKNVTGSGFFTLGTGGTVLDWTRADVDWTISAIDWTTIEY